MFTTNVSYVCVQIVLRAQRLVSLMLMLLCCCVRHGVQFCFFSSDRGGVCGALWVMIAVYRQSRRRPVAVIFFYFWLCSLHGCITPPFLFLCIPHVCRPRVLHLLCFLFVFAVRVLVRRTSSICLRSRHGWARLRFAARDFFLYGSTGYVLLVSSLSVFFWYTAVRILRLCCSCCR